MIAFAISIRAGNEFLPEGEYWQQTMNLARQVIDSLSPSSKTLLQSHGFLEITASDLSKQLKENPRKGPAIISFLDETEDNIPPMVFIDGIPTLVDEVIVIDSRDLLRAEASDETKVDVMEVVGGNVTTEYPYYVLEFLRNEIKILKLSGMNEQAILRKLAVQYHPDLYQKEEEKVRTLSETYFKALFSLRDAGELK